MLVPNQYIKVKMSGKVIPHYRELGYEVKDIKTELRNILVETQKQELKIRELLLKLDSMI